MKIYTLTHHYRECGESVRDGYHFADQQEGKDEIFYQSTSGFSSCRYKSLGWKKLSTKEARVMFNKIKKKHVIQKYDTDTVIAIMVKDESSHHFGEDRYNMKID